MLLLPVKLVVPRNYKSIVDIIPTKLFVEVSTSISWPLILWLVSHNQHAAAMSIFTLIP